MTDDQRGGDGLPQCPLFGGMLQSEAGEFGSFLGCQLLRGGGARVWLSDSSQRGAPAGEFGDDQGDGAGVTVGQRGICRLDGLPSCRLLGGRQDFEFGGVDRRDGLPRETDGVASRSDVISGLAGFGGLLARPVQRSRYWSRSNPLPLSRSFHQASPFDWRSRSSASARAADSMMAS